MHEAYLQMNRRLTKVRWQTVSKVLRCWHSKMAMTMEVYAHVLPTMQADAAALLGGLLQAR